MANYRTIVYYDRIAAAFTDAGMLAPEIRELSSLHLKLAKDFAPKRTGRLKRLHYKWIGSAKGYGRTYYVGTKAPYAIFLRGTAAGGAGRIFPKNHKELELRPIPYSWFRGDSPGRFKTSVQGQPPHEQRDWLKLAGAEAMAYYGLGRSRFPNATVGGRRPA